MEFALKFFAFTGIVFWVVVLLMLAKLILEWVCQKSPNDSEGDLARFCAPEGGVVREKVR
jgi:hypothetical protein